MVLDLPGSLHETGAGHDFESWHAPQTQLEINTVPIGTSFGNFQ